MIDTTSATVLAGLVLPVLISFLKRLHYSDTVNAVIALAVYLAGGVATVVLSGQPIDPHNLIPTIAIVTASGTVFYNLFWQNWGDPQIQAKLASPVAPVVPPAA